MNYQKQYETNRLNALFSTGPKTELGKAKSRANSTKHGVFVSLPTMRGQMPEQARELFDALTEEHQPVGIAEEILVHKMTSHLLSFERASLFLVLEMDRHATGLTKEKIGLMLRYQTTADRGYYKALDELRKTQKERRLEHESAEKNGFVSQTVEAPPEPPAPQPETAASTPPKPTTPAPIAPVFATPAAETAAPAAPIAENIAPEVPGVIKKAA